MIRVTDLRKRFPAVSSRRRSASSAPALAGVSFEVPDGSFFTLLGPSGCGKTTTLRSIAGLARPDSGEIEIDGSTVYSSSRRVFLSPERRGVGMVFQSYAIWPHMTVFENVAYPLRAARIDRHELRKRVAEALDVVGLGDLGGRPAPSLSGGQQQRVALARAVVARPRVLLLDEPLSNLDARLRDDMRAELRRLQVELGLTAVYVTHDQQEALGLSDLIAVMNAGELLELGTPEQIYLAPRRRFTAQFVGRANFLDGRVVRVGGGEALVDVADGRLLAAGDGGGAALAVGDAVTVFFRPENVHRVAAADAPDGLGIRVTAVESTFLGEFVECRLRRAATDELVEARFPVRHAPRVGEEQVVTVDAENCRVVAESPIPAGLG